MSDEKAFFRADFDWVVHTDGVWSDSLCDVAELHGDVRAEISDALENTDKMASPLGFIITGEGGSGKTHLLGALRRHAFEIGAGFVSVDLTDVHDFYELLLISYVHSIMQPDKSGTEQFRSLLAWIIDDVGGPVPGRKYVADMAACRADKLPELMSKLIKLVHKKHPGDTLKYQDVLRSLVLLNRDELEEQSLGFTWLQGNAIDEEAQRRFKYTAAQGEPRQIVVGLSWFFALRNPILLVLDQMDAIVGQHNFVLEAEREGASVPDHLVSQGILTGIAGGLAALHDVTRRTLVVLSCLDGSIKALSNYTPRAFMERFHTGHWLSPLRTSDTARAIVAARLAEAYARHGFTPPYPTWPFRAEAFDEVVDLLPRELLQRCEAHRLTCRRAGAVTELEHFGARAEKPVATPPVVDGLGTLDQTFDTLKAGAPMTSLLDAKTEDTVMAKLLSTAARCLILENPPQDDIDAIVDTEFPGTKAFRPLHARIRMVHHGQEGLEKHYCLRALQHTHANAFQARLNAALTCSGIDRELNFRHLVLFRTEPLPGGSVTKARLKAFRDRGGLLVTPVEEEWRALYALQEMSGQGLDDFESWLRSRRPVSRMEVMRAARLCKGENGATTAPVAPTTPAPTDTAPPPPPPDPPPSAAPAPAPKPNRPIAGGAAVSMAEPGDGVYLGHRVVGSTVSPDPVSLPVAQLRKHVVVLAGAGSGKSVLLRRIIEEAALRRVPSIIVDGANDLSRMGDRWPEAPAAWTDADAGLAERYFAETETMIWTPGVERGNPMTLAPLPDFRQVADEADERVMAVDMARESLAPIVAAGRGATNQKKLGVLTAALNYHADHHGGSSLEDFAELLGDLPIDAQGGIGNAGKLAADMADAIRAQLQVDPLLRGRGTPLDPALLLGLGGSKTRISVVNIANLPGLAVQQQFVNQLAMTLFSWIKRNPAPAGVALRGLLIIDEAKDFVPSRGATACKGSLQRLTAQARKYGLGVVFATQAPKDLEHTIISNCSTHFYGKASSPAAIATIQDQLAQRGGRGDDVGRLTTGRFYVHNADAIPSPTRIATPLCLSHHPASPPSADEVIEMARRSRG